jgi:hypothetical protein
VGGGGTHESKDKISLREAASMVLRTHSEKIIIQKSDTWPREAPPFGPSCTSVLACAPSHPSARLLILVASTWPAARIAGGRYGHSSPKAAQKAGCCWQPVICTNSRPVPYLNNDVAEKVGSRRAGAGGDGGGKEGRGRWREGEAYTDGGKERRVQISRVYAR